MIKLLKFLVTDDNKPISIRVINLIALYANIWCFFALVLFAFLGFSGTLLAAIVCLWIVFIIMWIMSQKSSVRNVTLVLCCYIINLVIFPTLFYSGGGMFSGMPLLFIAGYILTFIFMNGITLLTAACIFSVWYYLVIVYSYYYPYTVSRIIDKNLLPDVMMVFLITTLVMVFVLGLHNSLYRKLRISIEEAKNSIEETGNVKSRFLANMSHELRTPMNAILGMAELLDREDKSGKIALEINMIKESAFSLLTTINNVLTYSKLDSHKMEYIPEQFSFGQILRDVLYTISMEVSNRNIQLTASIDPQIPDILYGDDTHIRQVFNYILFNAARDTENGRIMMDISFKRNIKRNNITVFVRVSDTGIGLSDDEKNSIFKSFEIYDSRKNSQLKRLGLEFTICRDILALMNGSIKVESINGVGTSVYFQFDIFNIERTPIVKIEKLLNKRALIFISSDTRIQSLNVLMNQFGLSPDYVTTYTAFDVRLKDKKYDFIFISDSEYARSENLIRSYGIADITYIMTDYMHVYGDFGKCRILRSPITCLNFAEAAYGTWKMEDYMDKEFIDSFMAPDAKVLVVDDNMVNIKVATGLLQKYNIVASIATSGHEALEKIKIEKYDLIFLDQMMPEMDGAQTLKHIRESVDEHNRKVPIVCMTATIGNEVRDDLLRQGFQEYLAKPIKTRYLEEILKAFLNPDLILPVIADEDTSPKKAVIPKEEFAPGLSSEVGLDRCGGDESTYYSILNTYFSEGEQKLESIPQLLTSDLSLFVINVHAVKGSSASIGALEVSELFRQLEMAGKDEDYDFINSHLENALDKYQEIIEEVKEYLIEKGEFEEEECVTDLPASEFDIATLEAFKTYVDDFETDLSDGIIEEWSSHNYSEEINGYIRLIKKYYEAFDTDMAMEVCDELLERLK